MPLILLVRHAQASFGAADYDVLSERGQAQARLLAADLERRGIRPQRVACGTLARQRDTATPIAAAADLEPVADARWDEYDSHDILTWHGSAPPPPPGSLPRTTADGRPFQAVLDDALERWVAAGAEGPAHERWPAFAARARAALDDVADGLPRGAAAVVLTSGGVIAALAAALLGAPAALFVALNRVGVNTGVSRVAVGRRGSTLVAFNEHAHLERAGASHVTYR